MLRGLMKILPVILVVAFFVGALVFHSIVIGFAFLVASFCLSTTIASWWDDYKVHRLLDTTPRTVDGLLKKGWLVLSSGAYEVLIYAVGSAGLLDHKHTMLVSSVVQNIKNRARNYESANSMGALLSAFSSRSGNPVEEVLTYLDRLNS